MKTVDAGLSVFVAKQMEGLMAELAMLAMLGVFAFCATMSVLCVLD